MLSPPSTQSSDTHRQSCFRQVTDSVRSSSPSTPEGQNLKDAVMGAAEKVDRAAGAVMDQLEASKEVGATVGEFQ
jgi:hypothetical protein